jgi:hypothetical protein
MTDVACFCNCLYSFEGDAGSCPQCGAVAAVRTAAASTGRERSPRAQPPLPEVGVGVAGARATDRAAGNRGLAVVCVPGQQSPSPVDSVDAPQLAMFLTTVSPGLPGRDAPGSGAGHRS